MFTFYNPVKVYKGYGCIRKITEILQDMNCEKANVLILAMNEFVFEKQDVKQVIEENPKCHFICKAFTKSNPEISDLYEIYEESKEWNLDVIVAVGGGSVLDIGKSLCWAYGKNISSQEELKKIIQEKPNKEITCKWIGVPTTAGTGSEATCWATIWNSAEGSKLSIESKNNYAYAALIDTQFAENMPLPLIISSAVDAMSHATEAYWAKHSNPVSKALSLYAIKTIVGHIEDVFVEEKRKEAQEYLAEASLIAGMSFSNTKTTAGHSMSYPLTINYKIPHGLAVGMVLPDILRENKKQMDLSELLMAYQVENEQQIKEKFSKWFEQSEMKYKLSDWGVTKEDVSLLVEESFTKGRMDNNPVELTKEAVEEIYTSLL